MTSDAALVLRARGGDESAWDELLHRMRDKIRVKALTYFVPDGDLNDLIQEGNVGLLKAVRDYRPERGVRFSDFAALCIQRQIITAVKAATRVKNRPVTEAVSLSAAPRGARDPENLTFAEVLPGAVIDDPLMRLLADEEFGTFLDAFDELTPLERSVAVRIANGESYQEIGESLDVRCKQIDNAIQRVRRKVARAMEAAQVAA